LTKTGATVKIPVRKVLKFSASKPLKEAVDDNCTKDY